MGNERRLDLTRLQPDTADRQLVVDPAAVDEHTRFCSHPVAGAVDRFRPQ